MKRQGEKEGNQSVVEMQTPKETLFTLAPASVSCLQERDAKYGGHNVQATFAIAVARITIFHFVLWRVAFLATTFNLIIGGRLLVLVQVLVFTAQLAWTEAPKAPAALPKGAWTAASLLADEGRVRTVFSGLAGNLQEVDF